MYPPLRTRSTADLLATPGIMLGFRPTESCVVMGMVGPRVECLGRTDLCDLTVDLVEVAAQFQQALGGIGAQRVIVIAYAAQPLLHEENVQLLADSLGLPVIRVLLTDGDRYWDVTDGQAAGLEDGRWAWDDSPLLAEAVYRGRSVDGSRQQSVAQITEGRKNQHPDRIIAVRKELMPDVELLGRLTVGTEELTLAQARQLAVCVEDPECAAELLNQLEVGSADRLRRHLLAAWRVSDDVAAPHVGSLLGMACWLAGHPAEQVECIRLVAELAPEHPILGLLDHVHRNAYPPSVW